MIQHVTTCEISPVQIPSPENGFHAVCTSRIVLSSGETFSTVGEAVGDDNGPDQTLLQHAGQRAYDWALELMRRHEDSGCAEPSVRQAPCQPKSSPAPSRQNASKPITDKQKRFIEITAAQNGKTLQDAEHIALQLYKRPIHELTTREVNPILDELKA